MASDQQQPLPVFVPKAASPVRIIAGLDLMPVPKARTRLADIFARIAPGPCRTKARDLLFDLLINGRVEPCRALSDLQADAIAIRHRGNESPSDAAVLEFVGTLDTLSRQLDGLAREYDRVTGLFLAGLGIHRGSQS